jgi:hypothetical protein
MADRDPRGAAPPDAPGAGGPRRPRSPDHRPLWLLILASLTLVYGGVLLISSLETWRDPRASTHAPETRTLSPAEDEIARALADVNTHVVSAHLRTIRGNAAASLPVALLMLFAAAATLSRDRRGRAIVLGAAWTGIAYQLGTLWLTLPVVRDYAREAAPLLARLAALQGSAQDPNASPEAVAKIVVALPVFVTAVAVMGSLVLIRFFGGRRGRVLYGLEGGGDR